MNKSNKYLFPFILVTSLFFFWGFLNNLNPILIPHLKKAFSLSALQASLIDSAVYVGYFAMALPAGIIMRRYGYKAGIITGLLLFATGAFLFIPAANTQLYPFFLGALFMALINNMLIIGRVSGYWQEIILGLILIMAVGLDQWLLRRAERAG